MSVTTRAQVVGSVIAEDVTDETLAAAKAGDRDAGASILAHLESRLVSLARRAGKLAGGDDNLDYTEDLIQEANLVAWECLAGFEGDDLDAFRAYAYRYVEKELSARARDMINGSDDDTDGKKLFKQMVEHFRAADVNQRLSTADYVDLAEKAVQDKAMVTALNGGAYKSRIRMSADAAYAARLAYQGRLSLSVPAGRPADSGSGNQTITLADTLPATDCIETQACLDLGGVRPFQWVAAARTIESELTLPRDAEARDAVLVAMERFRAGTIMEEDLALVESMPCRSKVLGDAVAMLRSLLIQRESDPEPSTAAKQTDAALGRGSVALNAQRAQLEKNLDNIVRRTLVRKVVGMLSPRQAYIMAATFGFMGKFRDDAQLAREMAKAGVADIDADRVRKDREKARAAFAKKWADLISKTGSESAALELAAMKAAANDAKAQAQGITFLADFQED